MTQPDLSVETKDFDTIGGRLSRACDAMNLSATEVARLVGVEEKTFNAWECDQSEPRSNQIIMLAGALGVSPSWLLFGRGTSPAQETTTDSLNAIKLQLDSLKSHHEKIGFAIDKIEEALENITSEDAE